MSFPVAWSAVSGTNQFYHSRFAQRAGMNVAVTRFYIFSSSDGTTWTQRFSHAVNSKVAAAYSPTLDLFVAYTGKKILTSPDGITWMQQIATTGFELNDLEWSAAHSVFIGCGRDAATITTGVIYTSPDGITWTQRASAVNRSWMGLAVNGTQCVAVGSDNPATQGLRLVSTDAIAWAETQISASDYFNDIERSTSLYVAVGREAASNTGVVYTSADGLSWTKITVPTIRALTQLMWSQAMGAYVACADDPSLSSSTNDLLYSENATSWTKPFFVPFRGCSGAVYIAPYLMVTGSTSDAGAIQGDANISSVLTISGPPIDLPFVFGSVFLDAPSFLYGFAGSVSGTVGAYAEGGADLYGFAGNLEGTGVDGATTSELYGFAGTVAGYGGAYADLYGFAGTVDGLGLIPDTFAAELSGFAGVLDGRISEVAQATADLYGFAGTVAGLGGADSELYGFAGVVEGAANVLETLAGELYGFAGTVEGAIKNIVWAKGELYGFAGTLDSETNGAVGDLYGFAGVVDSVILLHDASGQINLNLHDAATVLNVRTTETTRYRNVRFLHLVTVGGQLYGVRTDGLYALKPSVATDAGATAPINGAITTKETDFSQYQSKRVPYLYANSDAPGQLKVTPYVDGAQKLAHLSRFNDRKVHLARGVSGRYHHYVIEGIVNLQGVEILPELRQRRVK